MFPIRNLTSLKPGMSRYDRLISAAQDRAERFALTNPGWKESTFILLQWRGNEYLAYVKYMSTQGISKVDVIF